MGATFGIVILCYCWKDCYYCIFPYESSNEAYMIAFDFFFFMRFYGTLIYDYVVQVGELLEFLCVDLHNQFDNVINQCSFNFCIVVHNGARHIIA